VNLPGVLKRIFGIGPLGNFATILVWYLSYSIDRATGISPIPINKTFRIILLIIFLSDAIYLVFGGVYQLIENGWGKQLIKTGPFRLIRHPLYSAVIYSGTGALAVFLYSWIILAAVLPISLLWSWLVQKEEEELVNKFGSEYLEYIEMTGQFLPSLKKIYRMESQSSEEK
jgi:protein-S-isoprenylcysteine O-methyltransferase Ste14